MQAHSLNGVWLLAETAAPRLLWPSPGSPTARERKHIAVVIWEHNKGPCVSAVQSTQHTWLVTSPRGDGLSCGKESTLYQAPALSW